MTYAKQVANEVSEAMDADGYLVDEVIKAVEAVIERCAQEAEHAWDPRRPEVTARAIRALAASPALQPAPVACPFCLGRPHPASESCKPGRPNEAPG